MDPLNDPDVQHVLGVLTPSIQAVLGPELVALYTDGSLARGDFDVASDIDFVAVVKTDLTPAQFADLQTMHDRVARLDTRLALEIEGFYVPPRALGVADSRGLICANLERGPGERLKPEALGAYWIPHLWVLREHGAALFGPPPRALIAPVTADDLRVAMRELLTGWATRIESEPVVLASSGYRCYAVLSLCRILYTLERGDIISKVAAAEWATRRLDRAWAPLIAQVVATRLEPGRSSAPDEIETARAFIRHVIGLGLEEPP